MQIETFKHAESIHDAQEKQARNYGLAFAAHKRFVKSRFGAHLFQTRINLHKQNQKIYSSLLRQRLFDESIH